jgi:hypothetical protein
MQFSITVLILNHRPRAALPLQVDDLLGLLKVYFCP